MPENNFKQVAVVKLNTIRSKDKLFTYLMKYGVIWMSGDKLVVSPEPDFNVCWKRVKVSTYAVCIESHLPSGKILLHGERYSFFCIPYNEVWGEDRINYDNVPKFPDVNSFLKSGIMEKVAVEQVAPPKPTVEALVEFVSAAVTDCRDLMDKVPYDLDEPVVEWKKRMTRFITRAEKLGAAPPAEVPNFVYQTFSPPQPRRRRRL